MKKRIWSSFAILLVLFRLLSDNIVTDIASAYDDLSRTDSSVIKVVLPTDVNFFIDPYEIIEEGTMIISRDFNIINKSSVPIKVDMSFKLSAENDIPLYIKRERHAVSRNNGDREIWFAAVFSNDIEQKVTSLREINIDEGITLLQKPINNNSSSPINKANEKEQGVESVSGAAISVIINNGSNIIAEDTESKTMIESVSGSSISLICENFSNTGIANERILQAESVSGSSISAIIEDVGHIVNADKSIIQAEAVSGQAISSIIYEDTERVIAGFGDVSGLTENSPNVLVITDEFNNYTLFLNKAKSYYLSDGSIVTGEVAEGNSGVMAFRFIGELNPNANWRTTSLKVTTIYSIEEIYDQDGTREDLDYQENDVLYYNKDEDKDSD